ncbi:antigen-presenting glycoprotein CD1d [Sorex fumeus]|uniref:antigen-presenting glycoprotein CD1d n=1 Tax=Sorex fumeus TaxID=62283 RepID=UPI0024AC86AC|nr:antigen-presenting glycoprotein CD1d [Sorex fumeus]
MRWLLFLLLCELHQIWASSEASQGTVPFRCLQISSFANSSGWRTDISLWLGELLTHTWKNDSNSFRFLKPWSQGTFTHKQWQKLQHLFQVYRSSFTRDVQEFAKMLQVNYPFDIQMYVGCDVKPKSSPEVFLHVAFQGTEILSFQGTCWVPAPDAPQWVDKVCEVMNQDRGTRETVQWLLNDTCPEFVRGIVEMGKSELEKQVKPVAWLSRGPALGPGRLLLVCHVSGFYPKPVQVTWMRGEQKQPGTQQGDILPNADGTWSLQVSLDVVSGEAAGLTCHIKHSSLGDQDIILYWEVKHVSVGLIVLVILLLLLIGGGLFIRFKKPCSYQDIL